MAKVRISILVDNSIPLPTKMLGEYGFSALVEDLEHDKRILFDTGSTGKPLLYNLGVIGVDPDDIDYVVLSHRHYDHTGGLKELLQKRSSSITIISHPDLFVPAYTNILDGVLRDIGIPFTRDQLESLGAKFLFSRESVQITPNVKTMGEIPRDAGPSHTSGMARVIDGNVVEDSLPDDTGVGIITGKGVVVMTGCGHSGVENIMSHADKLFGNVYGLVGGLHLLGASESRLREVSSYLAGRNLGLLVAGHCTGPLAQWLLLNAAPNAYRIGGVGFSIEI
ncbi:MAG: MBL fold metallo-hydrolase [Desulfurococcales archaeon]|nr:MBL fold metallo-hydrolase [Desulfurococcales archaeon]